MRIFSIAKRINKKITIQKADDPNKNSNDQASFLTESYSFDLPFFWKFTYIPRYIKYFNSFECEPLPSVHSKKYSYINESELYKSVSNQYYYKKKIYDWIDKKFSDLDERKSLKTVTEKQLQKLNILRPITLRY